MKQYQSTKFETFNNKVVYCYLTTEVYLTDNDILPVVFITKGKAKVHSDDKFDELIGQRIAESRAVSKMYHKLQVFLRKSVKELESVQTELCLLHKKLDKLILKESDHLTKLKS